MDTVTANGTLTSRQAASFHPILAGQQLGGCRCSRDTYVQIADMVDACQCKIISWFLFFWFVLDVFRFHSKNTVLGPCLTVSAPDLEESALRALLESAELQSREVESRLTFNFSCPPPGSYDPPRVRS